MLLPIFVFVLVPATLAGDSDTLLHALEFGKTVEDYISFETELTSLSEFSVCAWIKRLHTAVYPTVFNYYSSPDEIMIGSNGGLNYVDGDNVKLQSKFPGQSVWFHYCLTWAVSGGLTVYLDGQNVGNCTTPERKLAPAGHIVMGKYAKSSSADFVFGGQLHKFNLYSEQLKPSEVEKMFTSGLCSAVEVEEYGDTRVLKWEDVLLETRYGRVEDRTVSGSECVMSNLMGRINKMQSRIKQTINIWSDLDL